MESLIKKIEQIKIDDDCYFVENLEHKHNFLNDLEEKIQERIFNYKKGEELIKRVHLIEFYWFNSSPFLFGEKETESSLICNCNYCKFFLSCFLYLSFYTSSWFVFRYFFFGFDFIFDISE